MRSYRHRRRPDEIRRDGSRFSCFSLRQDLRKFSGDKFISTIRNLESESPRANEGNDLSFSLSLTLSLSLSPSRVLDMTRGFAHVSACVRAYVYGWPEEERMQEQARRKAERNVYMKRPLADAVTRDSAHRPKERLPSPCFFLKLLLSLLSSLPRSFPFSRFLKRSRCFAMCACGAAGRFFDIKRAREPEGRHRDTRSTDEQGKQRDQRDIRDPGCWYWSFMPDIIYWAVIYLFFSFDQQEKVADLVD